MKKLILIALVTGALAFAAVPRSDAQVYFNVGFGFPGYYGYYPYGYYYPYRYYYRPYYRYGSNRYYRYHRPYYYRNWY